MLQQDDLQLRLFQPEDKSILAMLANNKNIWNNLTNKMPHPYQESDAVAFIEKAISVEPPTILVMEWKGIFSGVIGLHPQSDVYTGIAEMGYWVGEPYWGNGIASRAVALMLNYGFETLGYRRIYAAVYDYNPTSMRVLLKNGFQKEGIFRKAVIKNGRIWDEHRFAVVR